MNNPWWTITYLTQPTKTYNSDMIPLSLLPEIDMVSIPNGHKFDTDDIEITSGPVKLDLRTGTIWVNNQVAERVPDFKRVILHKRRFVTSGTRPVAFHHVHLGLLNDNGEGFQVRVTHTGDVYIEPHVVSVGV